MEEGEHAVEMQTVCTRSGKLRSSFVKVELDARHCCYKTKTCARGSTAAARCATAGSHKTQVSSQH